MRSMKEVFHAVNTLFCLSTLLCGVLVSVSCSDRTAEQSISSSVSEVAAEKSTSDISIKTPEYPNANLGISMGWQRLFGTWQPQSENYFEFGDLIIKPDKLTWGSCKDISYSVLRAEDDTYYVELQRTASCRLRGDASFLIFLATSGRLKVSICHRQTEMNKDPKERLCSWGLLSRKN